MVKATRILVVDDETAIRRLLRTTLTSRGYEVLEAENGGSAIELAIKEKPDLILLDLGLPDIEGLEVLRQIRRASLVPVIIQSVRGDDKAKVAAFDLGADDYVTKPFSTEELFARIGAGLRHRLQQQGETPIFRSGDLTVDLPGRIVTVKDRRVRLSAKEFDLLHLLVRHAGKVLTHQFVLRELWGDASVQDIQYLRVYIRALRHKLEEDPAQPRYLLTEIGIGYRLATSNFEYPSHVH